MDNDEYSKLHKKIDQLDIDQDAKDKIHKAVKSNKDDPKALNQFKEQIDKMAESPKILTSAGPTESKKETKKKVSKADVVLQITEMPDNCYFEINCEGKVRTVQLPPSRTSKPIRIRPKGEGTLVFRLSKDGESIHEIDRSEPGYKFTDFHWNNSRQMWRAINKFDPV